jgi:hypothetical protein
MSSRYRLWWVLVVFVVSTWWEDYSPVSWERAVGQWMAFVALGAQAAAVAVVVVRFYRWGASR